MKVLVTYASKYGSTAEVAEKVAEILRSKGLEVDLSRAKEVTDISSYDAVILGSPFRVFRWLREARKFVKRNQDALAKIPVACFALGLSLMEDTQKNRAQMLKWLSPISENIKPVDIGLFGGRWDKKRVPFYMRIFPMPEGDFRRWEEIVAWAEELVAKLKSSKRG